MVAFMIIEMKVPPQAALGLVEIGVVVEVDLLVFHAVP